MLKIRAEQLDALSAARWDDFFERAARHVRAAWPNRVGQQPDERLRGLFDSSASRARRHGLATERQIVCVFEASVLLGDRFEDRPGGGWAGEVLASRLLDADDRANLLLATAAAMSADPEAAHG